MRKLIVLLLAFTMVFVLCDISSARKLDIPEEEPLTDAEKSGWTRTSTSQEVVDYCKMVADMSGGRIHYMVSGYTAMGKPIPMLVMGKPAPTKPSEMGNRSSVFILCNIHSGEVEGKEAMLIFAREVAKGKHDDLISRIVVIIAPNMNADGNDFFGEHRTSTQPTPRLVGTRYTSEGYNLNRDFSKMEASETRAIYRIFSEWNPVLFLDAHATNGSRMRQVLSYSWGYHANTNKTLMDYNRTTFCDNVFGPNSFIGRKYNGERVSVPYGNFTTDLANDELPKVYDEAYGGEVIDFSKGVITWDTYGDLPRYTTNLSALGNRLGLLLECYSYDPYEFRVETQYAIIYGAIESVANDIDNINSMIKAWDDDAISFKTKNGGNAPAVKICLDSIIDSYPDDPVHGISGGMINIDSYVHVDGLRSANVRTDHPRTYRIPNKQLYTPIEEADMGALYIFEGGSEEAVNLLLRHGIEVQRLTKDTVVPDHLRFRIRSVTPTTSLYEGHWTNGTTAGYYSKNGISGDWVPSTAADAPVLWNPISDDVHNPVSSHLINAGSYVVSTSQRRGILAALLLEPRSNDGLFFWNFFDNMITGERGRGQFICPMVKTMNYFAIPEENLEPVDLVASEWPLPEEETNDDSGSGCVSFPLIPIILSLILGAFLVRRKRK